MIQAQGVLEKKKDVKSGEKGAGSTRLLDFFGETRGFTRFSDFWRRGKVDQARFTG